MNVFEKSTCLPWNSFFCRFKFVKLPAIFARLRDFWNWIIWFPQLALAVTKPYYQKEDGSLELSWLESYLCKKSIFLRNTRERCEMCSKLTIKTPKRRQWRRSGILIVKFEHISHLDLVFLMLTLSRLTPYFC